VRYKKMKINKGLIAKIIAIVVAVLLLASAFMGGMVIERTVAKNRINHNTYCESGAIVQKIEDEYLLRLDNGKYRLIESAETYADNTRVVVCFEMNDTDETADDRIIAISTDLYALSESLFTEEVAPTVG
jgi:hypothetical protein